MTPYSSQTTEFRFGNQIPIKGDDSLSRIVILPAAYVAKEGPVFSCTLPVTSLKIPEQICAGSPQHVQRHMARVVIFVSLERYQQFFESQRFRRINQIDISQELTSLMSAVPWFKKPPRPLEV